MSDIFNPPNSIWPNGMQVDSDGNAAFYPLGTNKVNVPTSSTQWPKGNKLVSPFVYQDDKLVGFADTKALTTDSQTTIYLPYEHIEAQFSAIEKGQLQIHAPNATTKKVSWKDSGVEEIPEAQYKYKSCKTVDDVKAVDANYKTTDIVDGNWSEPLWDLEQGDEMFYGCDNLTSFSSDLPSLTNGYMMFANCYNLTACDADLSNLTNGHLMFSYCSNLKSFSADLSSLTNGHDMFYYCDELTTFTSDLSSLTDCSRMFNYCSKLASFNANLSSLTNGDYMFQDCYNLTAFSSDLSSLTNGSNMFNGCSNLTTFNSDLSSLTDGESMFYYCDYLSEFDTDLPNLTNGEGMFEWCSNLTTFSADLSSLTDGTRMFSSCKVLELFNSDLPSLTNGYNMFYDCDNLTTFSADLSSLTDADHMFYGCWLLKSFNSNLSSLTNGSEMFYGCGNLTSFSSDLPSLTDGEWMFYYCNNLTTFSADLSSLTNGSGMFSSCKLDAPSIKNIIETINTYSGKLTLAMGCKNTTADKDLFAQEVGYADMTSLLAALQAKGWTVTAQYTGRPTTTYDLRRPSEDTLPVFVKFEEVDGEVITINQATHIIEDGSMSYRLTWFHETTGSTDGYTQFNSIEEAIETLNIKPIEK